MNKKTLFLLCVVAMVVLGLWLNSGPSQQRVSTLGHGGKLFPDLMAISADIDTISIREHTHGQLTFVRDNNQWDVQEADGFPANLALIRQMIHEMSNITLVEAKTNRPENYPLLGVQDLDEDAATGTEVRLMSRGETRLGLVIGRYEMPLGTYVRALDDTQSWLTDSRLIVRTDRREWLLSRLTEFNPDEIATIRFTPPGNDSFSLRRESVGGQYSIIVAHAESGYQIKEQRTGDLLAELVQQLSPIGASIVAIDDELHEMAQTEFVRFDGTSVRFLSWQDDNGYYVLYPPKYFPEEAAQAFPTLWKVAISETHFKRLNRTLDEVALPVAEGATAADDL